MRVAVVVWLLQVQVCMYLWWAHAASSETAGTICRLIRPTDTQATSSSPTRQRQKSLTRPTDTQASSSPERRKKPRRDTREEEEGSEEGRQMLLSPIIRVGKGGKGRDTSPEKVREMWLAISGRSS